MTPSVSVSRQSSRRSCLHTSCLFLCAIVADAVVSTATHSPRIIFARSFQAYVAGLLTEGGSVSAPSVARLVEQSVEYQTIRSRIREKFVEDFTDAEDFVTVYDRSVASLWVALASRSLPRYRCASRLSKLVVGYRSMLVIDWIARLIDALIH